MVNESQNNITEYIVVSCTILEDATRPQFHIAIILEIVEVVSKPCPLANIVRNRLHSTVCTVGGTIAPLQYIQASTPRCASAPA